MGNNKNFSKKIIIAFSSIYKELTTDNFLFKNKNAPIGDNLLEPNIELKKYADKNNFIVCTPDTEELKNIDIFVFIDMPDLDDEYFKYAIDNNKKRYLFITEIGLIRKENFNILNYQYFDKIFTYYDPIIDNKKYFKLNYTFKIPECINKDLSKKKKLCTLIAGNKGSDHPLELYSKRIEAIHWFENNHPDDFDLYGIGWDNYKIENRIPFILKVIKKTGFFRKSIDKKYLIKRPLYPSYKGRIKRKKDVLEKYKFCICYENFKDVPGWITEKIFDCFFAGCIPVYWGANNIKDHIPSNCFIDKGDFDSYEELYNYMINMKDSDYLEFLDNIETFIKSDYFYQFSIDYFINIFKREIVNNK